MRSVIATLILAFVLAFASAAPASATEGISLSNDGTTWGETLTEPMFDPDVRWVPGDSRTADFYVRSDAPVTTRMTLDVLSGVNQDLLETGDLLIEVRLAGGDWRSTTAPQDDLLLSRAIASGEAVRVEVRVTLLGSATNQSELLALDLRFRVTLEQASNDTDNGDQGSEGGNQGSGVGSGNQGEGDPDVRLVPPLALTGGAAGIGALLTIAGLVGLALLFAALRRRRKEESEVSSLEHQSA